MLCEIRDSQTICKHLEVIPEGGRNSNVSWLLFLSALCRPSGLLKDQQTQKFPDSILANKHWSLSMCCPQPTGQRSSHVCCQTNSQSCFKLTLQWTVVIICGVSMLVACPIVRTPAPEHDSSAEGRNIRVVGCRGQRHYSSSSPVRKCHARNVWPEI